MTGFADRLAWLLNEFGLASLWHAGNDAWLLIFARTARMFAYGANSLILALFFSSLNFSDFRIGLFFSLTLLGDVGLSFTLTLIADQVGRRRILLLGAALMILSGATFALFENFWILLLAAIIGVLSATGGDFGPFRAIEESTLSHLTTPKTRSDILAWYITSASIGSATGTLISGYLVQFLFHREDWRSVDVYHAIFWLYVIMGGLNVASTLMLSDKVEADPTKEKLDPTTSQPNEASEGLLDEDEGARQSQTQQQQQQAKSLKKGSGLFTQVSSGTLSVMYKLWFLLVVDSLADGMVSYSLTTYYIDQKFSPTASKLGIITSISYVLSAVSTVFAAPLAKRLGLINTMVFTHLPSSLAVLLFPLPSNFIFMALLFFLRTGLNNMDQAPRSAFIAAVVKPEERTAVMGFTSMLRTLAATCGPTVTGLLAGNDRFWIAFVAAGSLRICYDLGLWAMFVNMRLHDHEKPTQEDVEDDSRRTSDEEELRQFPPHTAANKAVS